MKTNALKHLIMGAITLILVACGGNTEITGTQIKTEKSTYEPHSVVAVIVSGELSGNKEDKDWIGIFKKGDEKKWGNQIAWNFTYGKKQVTIDTHNNMPEGEYEVALFLKNSENTVKTSASFTVRLFYNYGKKGKYTAEEIEYKETDDYFVYYPKGHIENAPVVLVSAYRSVHGYSGLMMYLASQGCYVIGHADRVVEGWSDVEFRRDDFDKAIDDAKKLNVDTTRLAAMGSSTGGMVSYYMMKYFKGKGYGEDKSFVIDIQGWYAPDMNKDDLENLNVDSLMLQIGGDKATPQFIYKNGVKDEPEDEDPRTLLTLSTILPSENKSYIVLNTDNHTYAKNDKDGESNAYYIKDMIDNKHDLLGPIDAMVEYEFFNEDGKYDDAKSKLFNIDTYDKTRKRVYDATMKFLNNGGKYTYGCSTAYAGINYCNDHELQ